MFAILLGLYLLVGATCAGPIVTTENGSVEGFVDGHVHVFRSGFTFMFLLTYIFSSTSSRPSLPSGIPYAASTAGENRFRHPKLASNWTGVKQAQALGRVCPQLNLTDGFVLLGDEDCLNLHIYAPKSSVDGLLPVMVYFYGGAFILGDAWQAGIYKCACWPRRTM